jgi:amino acid permease
MITLIIILVLTCIIASSVGYLGYLAFGATTKSLILYNLPNDDSLSITAKICYIFTVMGSFVLVIQPIFYILERGEWYKETFYQVPPSKIKRDKAEPEEEENLEAPQSLHAGSVRTYVEDDSLTTCGLFSFAILRIGIIMVLMGLSMLIPNIHLLMIFGGSILGTITNIYVPVIFYNRAYTFTSKNQKLEKAKKDDDMEPMMMKEEGQEDPEPEAEASDRRFGIKIGNIIVVIAGTIFGIWGLVSSF